MYLHMTLRLATKATIRYTLWKQVHDIPCLYTTNPARPKYMEMLDSICTFVQGFSGLFMTYIVAYLPQL